jgi:hypothetical protein
MGSGGGGEPKVEIDRAMGLLILGFGLIMVLGVIGIICALWVPLQAIQPMVDALAGENTSVSLKGVATVSLSVTLAGVVGLFAQGIKIRRQRREIERLRARVELLQEQLGLPNEGVGP